MAEYFSHDYDARCDSKLVKLQMLMGHEGKGIYWDLVEYAYQQDGRIKISELESIAFALHTTKENLLKVIEITFNQDNEYISSDRILRNIEERKNKSFQKSEAGRVGGIASGISRKEATVKQPLSTALSKTNETKQSKGKESKVKESKEVNTTSATKIVAVNKLPHAEFIESIKKHYLAKTGMPYKADSSAYVLADKLIKVYGIEIVIQKAKILAEACNSKKLWFTKEGWTAFTVEKLSNKWNELLPEKTSDDKWRELFAKQEAEDVTNNPDMQR